MLRQLLQEILKLACGMWLFLRVIYKFRNVPVLPLVPEVNQVTHVPKFSKFYTTPIIVTSIRLLRGRLSWLMATTCCQVPSLSFPERMGRVMDGSSRAAWT